MQKCVITVGDTEELNDDHSNSLSDLLCGRNTNFMSEVDLHDFAPFQAPAM